MNLESPFSDTFNIKIGYYLILPIICIALAISVVYFKHIKRVLNAKIQNNFEQIQNLEQQRSDLVLEKAVWGRLERVEKIANKNFGMVRPKNIKVIEINSNE